MPLLTEAIAEDVRRLSRTESLSGRRIARKLGISRWAVQAILHDQWKPYIPKSSIPHSDGPIVEPHGPFRRCVGCGGLVMMPCLACQLRSLSCRRLTP